MTILKKPKEWRWWFSGWIPYQYQGPPPPSSLAPFQKSLRIEISAWLDFLEREKDAMLPAREAERWSQVGWHSIQPKHHHHHHHHLLFDNNAKSREEKGRNFLWQEAERGWKNKIEKKSEFTCPKGCLILICEDLSFYLRNQTMI